MCIVHIRVATLFDVAAILEVGVNAWHDTYHKILPDGYIPWALDKWWTSEAIQRHIKSEQFVVLVAEHEQRIVGMAQAQVQPNESAILWRLYINSAYRGQGIGTRLIRKIEECLPPGIQTLYVEYYEQNKRAGAFYAALGFTFDRTETAQFQDAPVVSIFVKRALKGGVYTP